MTRRGGLDAGLRAGRLVGGRERIGGLHDPYDADWEPVRQAHKFRDTRLASMFVRARALGIVGLEEGRPGTAPRELVGYDDLRAHTVSFRTRFQTACVDTPTGFGRWIPPATPCAIVCSPTSIRSPTGSVARNEMSGEHRPAPSWTVTTRAGRSRPPRVRGPTGTAQRPHARAGRRPWARPGQVHPRAWTCVVVGGPILRLRHGFPERALGAIDVP
ncbi:hypothetical protein GCM10009809_40060 [Isoptericola hypogeus]|uniref:Uncharacterized protein n=1 Tax=Isoptericola hypogeus TaxID=300179 RepID=A0ABP4W002_9MICO